MTMSSFGPRSLYDAKYGTMSPPSMDRLYTLGVTASIEADSCPELTVFLSGRPKNCKDKVPRKRKRKSELNEMVDENGQPIEVRPYVLILTASFPAEF